MLELFTVAQRMVNVVIQRHFSAVVVSQMPLCMVYFHHGLTLYGHFKISN